MNEQKKILQIEIDSDDGLKGKKKLLTIVSLILLVIQFSGAKIIEANTLILKLSFTNQDGLALLLCISIVFLLVRYYGYARKYHKKLYDLWSSDLMKDPRIHSHCEHSNEFSGLLHEKYPKNFHILEMTYGERSSYIASYKSSWLLKKEFEFDVTNEHDRYSTYINVFTILGFKKYLYIFTLETKYRFLGFFNYRENLDIYAPYLLGFFSILSFVFYADLQKLIS